MAFDNNLPYAVFRFQVNHFLSMPVTGLQITSEIMVNDTTDRLQLLGISARQAVNTFSSSNAAIISDADKIKAEDAGLSTWDSQGYFIRCFSSFLKKNSYLCVTRKLVREYFNTIKLSYPAVNTLFEKMGVFYLGVKVVRLLAREELSILNFHVITDAILESDCIIAEDHDYIIFDERVPVSGKLDTGWKNNAENVAEFTRTRMRKYISHKYTKGQSTLAVYLLDPAIERMANLDARPLTPADNETIAAIHKAVEAEIGNLPPAAQTPIILTTISVRPHIKKLLESAYPQLAVLSYQELSPEMNIQPIARISLQ
jgi:type III secretion protein V